MLRLVNVCLSDLAFAVRCHPGDVDLRVFDFCVIADKNGVEDTGYVSGFCYCGAEATGAEGLARVVRRADSRDVRAWHYQRRREREALAVCKQKAVAHKLEMKIAFVRFDDRQRKVIFHFTAEKRVDFRELVKDLAATLHARIELWQIGVRDEAKRADGIGICGQRLCCASWMREFVPVSIRCAKTQDIQFSPARLSGVCGRLRCCLAFEQKQYVEMAKGVPTIGSTIEVAQFGQVKVTDRNLLSRTLTIADSEGQSHIVPVDTVKGIQSAPDAEAAAAPAWGDETEEAEETAVLIEEESAVENAARPDTPEGARAVSDRPTRPSAVTRQRSERRRETAATAPRSGDSTEASPDAGAKKEPGRRRRRGGRRRGKGAGQAHGEGDPDVAHRGPQPSLPQPQGATGGRPRPPRNRRRRPNRAPGDSGSRTSESRPSQS